MLASKYEDADSEAISCMANDNGYYFQHVDEFDDIFTAIMDLDEHNGMDDFTVSSIMF